MAPVASIVIPAHNAVAFLHDAVVSAQKQTLRDIEILIVDDCSTDGTWELAASFAASDPRIVPVRRPRRGGVSAARNDGIERAHGDWIALLDADDVFMPERIERMATLGEECGADLIADNLLERDFDTGADLGPHFPTEAIPCGEPLSLTAMLRMDMPDLPGPARLGYVQPVQRRDFLRRTGVRFAEDVQAGEDFLLYFECVARGARFCLTSEAYYVYRRRRDSTSNCTSSAPHYSAANRRLLALASGIGDRELMAMLRRRQELLDYSSFLHALEERLPLQALRYAHCGSPARIMTHLRAVRDVLWRPSGRARAREARGRMAPR